MTVEIFSAEAIGFSSNVQMMSMLSENDRALYYDLARQYRGRGAVIEIGPWLGSGTYQIARGLEESGRPWSLTVFDRFKWAQLYASRYPELGLKTGDSFLPLFRENLKPYIDRITPVAGEVGDIASLLPLRGDIELLFVDAPKNWELLRGVIDHVRSHMAVGSKLTFQDFFHITSRQIIWLLMSIPQLRLTRILDRGSSAVFTVEEPIPPLDTFLPKEMTDLTAADLLTMWNRLRHEFPEQRSGGLAAGMALDLLARDAVTEALAVLDEGAVGKPWQLKVADDLNRLIRPKGKDRNALIETGAYLRAQIHPATTRAAQKRTDIAARQTPREDAAEGVLPALERRQLLGLAEEMRTPTTAPALAARYAFENGPFDSRLFSTFTYAIRSKAVAWPLELAHHIRGEDVVEINSGITLHGVVMRALGAKTYVGIEPTFNPEEQAYASHTAAGTVRTKYAIGEVCQMLSGLSYVTDLAQLGAGHRAGVVLARTEADQAELETVLRSAKQLLRADGRLLLRWRNPLSWSGHGQAPQLARELDPENSKHVRVADWAHLRKDTLKALALPQVQRAIEGRLDVVAWNEQMRTAIEADFEVLEWEEQTEDPEAVLRLTQAIRRQLPKMPVLNFLMKSIQVTAKPRSAAR